MALEILEIECEEEAGRKAYEKIASDVLGDLDLIKVVDRLYIFIDPKIPVFVAAGRARRIPRQIRVSDFTAINIESKTVISVSDERYLADFLKILWKRYGNDRVEQKDRFTIVLYISPGEAQGISDIVVANPSETIHRDIVYAMKYIGPEGFKVRKQHFDGEFFSYIASEDTLDNDMAEKLLSDALSRVGVKK